MIFVLLGEEMGLLGCMRWEGEGAELRVGPDVGGWEAEPCTIWGVDVYTLLLYSSRDYDILVAFFNLW